MALRETTAPFPDTSWGTWAVKRLVQPWRRPDGLVAFACAIYATEQSMNAGDEPFLINSWLATVRELQQRILITPTGAFTHKPTGLTIDPKDLEDFLTNDPRASRWVGIDANGKWEDDQGRTFNPFMFPTYYGALEGLDPQWNRETYLLSQEGQVQEFIDRYLRGAEPRKLSGDRRGTTLEVRVGASLDDTRVRITTFSATDVSFGCGVTSGNRIDSSARLLNITIVNAATIIAAYLTVNPSSNDSDSTLSKVRWENDDDPLAPTSRIDFEGRSLLTGVDWDPGAWTADVPEDSPSTVSR